ncbi:MAG: DNA-processing protein DprA [Candidatus Pacebacteria bacterium]|nr:DNA-processing protein DprA [Candidatus Paceibacterota bacterium]
MTDEIKSISIRDKSYPKILKEIKDAPEVLYYRGELKEKENCFAIVGTRRCSDYGKQIALEISGDLSEAGLTIVSGLAPGIDTFSHTTAVERNKRTIAVLGTGLDEKTIYPQTNLELAKNILETGGALLSEYPAGTHGSKLTFPHRNRIVSGMSLGVLVIEAKEKSGSLITADFARKQGKKLFAVPGSVHSPNSWGPNWLIKKGFAKLAGNAEDILKELKIKTHSSGAGQKILGETSEENLILDVLKEGNLDIEKIIEKTKLPAATVASTVAILEIKGIIRNLGGNSYATNHS